MLSLGSYLLGAVEVAIVVISLAFAAYRLRARLLGDWSGAPARLVEVVVAVGLLTWLVELLGVAQLFYGWLVVASSALVAALVLLWTRNSPPAGGPVVGDSRRAEEARHPSTVGATAGTGPAGGWITSLLTLGVVAIVFAHWAITTKHALDRGIFNFDSLWYHMPFSVDMVQNHSVTGFDHTETVFLNWFYPQNSELLHAVGIALTDRDTLSLFLNFGWLAVAFLAAWCVGRPYGRGHPAVVAAAILLECHTLVVREPGAAKNDLMAAALLLAGIAILVEAWNRRGASGAPPTPSVVGARGMARPKARPHPLEPGWAPAVAGLAVGLAAGTKVTVLAMAAALSLAVIVLAPAGRRWAAAGWWFVPALLGGGYWYLRNLVAVGNPVPALESLGPIPLPHPDRLQVGRPDFNVAHYATDTGVWSDYFSPGLHEAFGSLWPLVVLAALAAALLAIFSGRDRIVRWVGGVALFGMVAYLFTPLSAAGAEGEPVGFGINIRFLVPALLAGLVLVPLPRLLDGPRRQLGLLAALVLVFLVTDRPDEALHDAARTFALLVVVLAVVIPAALWLLRERGGSRALFVAGCIALVLAVVAIGYPLQRHYLDHRFANTGSKEEQIPGMDLDSTYRWARGIEDARIGLVGTSAGFAGYGLYGTDLSNRVRYLGEAGANGAFNAIPTCAKFRAAVNDADLDYLVTAPFLNFLHPGDPVSSPEARWLRGEDAVEPVLRSGPVTVWEVTGGLDPEACGSANAPLKEVPDTPDS